MTSDVKFENMTISDLETVLDWAAQEGWNPGLADAEAFYAADPKGFFVAKRGGDLIAAISVVNHGPEDAFLGLYICRPECRGQGIGLSLWNHALKHAGKRSVGLDGVPAQEGNYRVSGFVRTGASLRYEGRWPARNVAGIRAATKSDTDALIALDARAGGVLRLDFMSAWAARNDHLRASRVLMRDDRITGFATWRACLEGTKIGPIVASATANALDLIADIADLRPEGPLYIDVPESNSALRAELETAGFTVSFSTARMYLGRPPTTGPTLQAIATMELG